ncbi:MAG: aminotransferase class I/II-fold pyridoxal phosphate-dependent enzyme [Planctomycetota bacterium]
MTSQNPRIYLSPPHMAPESREFLTQAFDSNWIAPVGPDLTAFEKEFAEYVGVRHAIAVSSGTAALHLALRLVGIQAGDSVPISTMTFVAPANAIRYLGAEPVFIDSDARDWNMSADRLQQALEYLSSHGKSPKAVVIVDVLGQCANYEALQEVCKDFGVMVVEDAAEALGATLQKQNAGTFGEIGCFSFNGNKMITTSGGGMLVTDHEDWAEKARYWATQAREPEPHYEHVELGYNYRMSNLLAAIGRGQLRVLDERVSARRRVFDWYKQRLERLPGITFMPCPPEGESSCWLTSVLVDQTRFGATREEIRLALEGENIESRPCWKPMHLQPLYAENERFGGEVAEMIFENGLCLPSGSDLTNDQLERIASVIEKVHRSAFACVSRAKSESA